MTYRYKAFDKSELSELRQRMRLIYREDGSLMLSPGITPGEAQRLLATLDAWLVCDGMDGPLPCMNERGHSGPHYHMKP